MTTLELIKQIYAKVNGEYEAVAENTDDYTTYLNAINRKIMDWGEEPNIKWQSLFDPNFTLTERVALDKEFYQLDPEDKIASTGNTVFDHVFLVDDSCKVKHKLKMVNQVQFDSEPNANFVTINSRGLQMRNPVSEGFVGLKIRVPVYLKPTLVKTSNDKPKIDSIPWLIAAVAEDMARQSPVPFIQRGADKFEEQAKNLMITMKKDNKIRQTPVRDNRDPFRKKKNSFFDGIEGEL